MRIFHREGKEAQDVQDKIEHNLNAGEEPDVEPHLPTNQKSLLNRIAEAVMQVIHHEEYDDTNGKGR